jgi:hypothetical protein
LPVFSNDNSNNNTTTTTNTTNTTAAATNATIKVAAAGGRKAQLFNRALAAKTAKMQETGALTHWLWDKLLFNKAVTA